MAAQELQFLYARSRDRADARHQLFKILDRCARSDVPELYRLAAPWTPGSPSCWRTGDPTGRAGVSIGPTEAINALIRKVKRVGHGLRNLANYRLRLLLTVGLDWRTVPWQAAPATPVRGRSPRLVA